ncbi:nucleotide disphospho-sugar-binding domain-containing protein [Kitasatospora sp. NBC_01302]|uniref:nucleotide disphospho-sugar-binding domain-containing protein n=1 Tax=Kitasatospora sp. NBC_01302 TaxID=2903575 RepID=UPI002E130987|nr:DUF1205 domain-containing protein [Kitasatospora sp. NBC_01302]
MRVLFTTSNWGGHYFCMIPLGWALQAAGHEVRVACPPEQVAAISQAGLIPVPVLHGPDMTYWARLNAYQEALKAPSGVLPPHPVTGRRVRRLDEFDVEAESARFWQQLPGLLERSYDNAVAFGQAWRPDLVLYDLMAPEGALVARLAGVPAVYHSLGLFGAMETEPGMEMGLEDPTGSFARHGAQPWDRSQITHVIDPSPDGAVPPHGTTTRIPVRYLPYNGPGELPDWLRTPPSRPRVCVMWGYSASAMLGLEVPALRHAINAAVDTGAEVVLTASEEQVEALGDLPPQVRVMRDFPLHLVLATSDAVVHHGGASALMTAAAAGVPQLALSPSDVYQRYGKRFAQTGAVCCLPGLQTSEQEVTEATHAVLHGVEYRQAARRVMAEQQARPTPADLVGTLVELASTTPERMVA